jgi:hypothetical protein
MDQSTQQRQSLTPANSSGPYLESWEQSKTQLRLKIHIKNLPNLKSSELKLTMKKTSLALKVVNQGTFKIENLYESIVPIKTTSIRKGKFPL